MKITIANPNNSEAPFHYELSEEMKSHFDIPINHAHTILDQINSGMYDKWFKGKKDMVCIDFGANVGLVSLYMLPCSKELISVEPTPSHSRLLVELMASAAPGKNVSIFPFALTDKESMVVFATGHATENKITSEEGYGNGKMTVEARPLSWFVKYANETVDFCKVDIEGGEMLALTIDELKSVHGKVKTFFVEVHPAYNGGMEENREELLRRFKEAGYKTEIVDYQTIVAYEN